MRKWINFHVVKCKGKEMGKINPNFVCSVMGFEQDITTQERDLGVISIEPSDLSTHCRYL